MKESDKEKISIIIPVYNEGDIINELLSHLVNITSKFKFEIIISEGHKDLTTINSVEKKYLDLRIVKTLKSPLNRGNQMNTAAENANGEILLFLHADTFISGPAFEYIPIALKENCAGAFKLGIDSNKIKYRIIEKFIDLRTTLTKIPYGDQAFFIKRSYFKKLEGFIKYPIMEDVDLMRRIKKDGVPIVIPNHKVVTSCRRWEEEGVIKCTLRNWFILIKYYFGVHPEQLEKYYRYK